MPDAATGTQQDVNPTPGTAATADAGTAATGTPAAPATTTVEVADRDAAELGRTLLEMGVTKDQLNGLLEAPQALQSIRYMVENDPQEFIRSLERTNPGAGENFLDKLSKLYVDRYARDGSGPGGGSGGNGGNANPNAELQAQIRELSEKVTGFQTEAQRQASASAQAQVQARFNARVDDLFGQLPPEKVPLTTYEKTLLRSALSNELASDPNAVKRVYNGNFVDVPNRFKNLVEGLVNDRKSVADAAAKSRERAVARSFPEISGGTAELPKDFYDVSDVKSEDLWDEGQLVKMLERTGGQ
jgi:hypothetical protein